MNSHKVMGPTIRSVLANKVKYDHRIKNSFQQNMQNALCRRWKAAHGVAPRIKVWRTNRNSNLYLLILPNGNRYLVKAVVGKPIEAARNEFEALCEFRRLFNGNEKIGVPSPVKLYEEYACYLQEFIEGTKLDTVWAKDQGKGNSTYQTIRILAQGLAQIHKYFGFRIEKNHSRMLVQDIQGYLGKVFHKLPMDIICKACYLVKEHAFPVGRIYQDFDLRNIIVKTDTSKLYVIDPPEYPFHDHLHRDIATFTVGIRKIVWRHPFNYSFDKSLIDVLIQKFYNEYFSKLNYTPNVEDRVLIHLWELERLGQISIWLRRFMSYRYKLGGLAKYLYGQYSLKKTCDQILEELFQEVL